MITQCTQNLIIQKPVHSSGQSDDMARAATFAQGSANRFAL